MTVIRELNRYNNEIQALQSEILKFLKKEFYGQIVEAIRKDVEVARPKIANAQDDRYKHILRSLRSGSIKFHRGAFYGRFGSRVSRELKKLGARWFKKEKAFKIHAADLPKDVRMGIDTSQAKLEKTITRVQEKIAAISPIAVAEKFNASKILDRTIFEADKSFKEKVKDITVAPQLTKVARKRLTDEYNKNLQKDIKEWTAKEIKSLREEVETFVFKGGRSEDLKKIIQESYGESESRAKFIASQETRLLTSKFRESRYRDAGSDGYYWRTVAGSPAHPVRDMHKALNGKFFKWSDPPITSEDGRRNHPGEDFNCRCYPDVVI